jgi:hypothetical protein
VAEGAGLACPQSGAGACYGLGLYTDSSGHRQAVSINSSTAVATEVTLPANAATSPVVGAATTKPEGVACQTGCTGTIYYTTTGAEVQEATVAMSTAAATEHAYPSGWAEAKGIDIACPRLGSCVITGSHTGSSVGPFVEV